MHPGGPPPPSSFAPPGGMATLPPGDIKTRSLYIGNLAPSVTDQLLWDVFSIIGPVESCKVIRDKIAGHAAGFGFVDYYDHYTAAVAHEKMNGKRIYDYEMKVNWAQSGGTREETVGHYHIFCGDLSPEVDDQALWNAFINFGSVSEARITRDPATNRSKGYGFVSFRIKEDADRALREMNGEWLGGRAIRCNWANTRPGRGGLTPGPVNAPAPSDIAAIAAQTPLTNTTTYIGNLAPDVNEAMLQQAFSEFGLVEEIRIQREKGFAFVRFNSHDSAARAIAYLNGRIMGSRPIRVSWGKDSGASIIPMPAAPYGAPVYGYSGPAGAGGAAGAGVGGPVGQGGGYY